MYFQQQGKFQPLDQVVLDSEYPYCPLLLKCEGVKRSVRHITEEKGEKNAGEGARKGWVYLCSFITISISVLFFAFQTLKVCRMKLYFQNRRLGLEVIFAVL